MIASDHARTLNVIDSCKCDILSFVLAYILAINECENAYKIAGCSFVLNVYLR